MMTVLISPLEFQATNIEHSTSRHQSCHSVGRRAPFPFPLPRTMSSPPLYSSAHPAVSFGTLGVRDGHFIGGTFVTSLSKATFDVVNPSNGQVLASAAAGDADDIHAAIEAAHACWRERSWAGRTGAERSVCFPAHHSMAGTPSLCSTQSLIWEYARSKTQWCPHWQPPPSIPLLPFGIHRQHSRLCLQHFPPFQPIPPLRITPLMCSHSHVSLTHLLSYELVLTFSCTRIPQPIPNDGACMPAWQEVLLRMAALITQHKPALARLESMQQGKTLAEAECDFDDTAACFTCVADTSPLARARGSQGCCAVEFDSHVVLGNFCQHVHVPLLSLVVQVTTIAFCATAISRRATIFGVLTLGLILH